MPSSGLSTPMEILKAALQKEEAAYRFYESLGENTHVEPVKDLVTQLKEEELRHMKLIQRKIVEFSLG
jgi:rubrerythrin